MKKIKTTPTKKNKKSGGKKHPLLVQILLGILAAGVLTVCIVATAVIANIVSFANGETAIDLDDYRDNQNQTTIIMAYDKNNNPYEYERLHGAENRIWVDLSNMSPYMYDVAVAMEDKRFETHHGVDWRRTASSAVYSALSVVTNKVKTQGGSTITQQLIKNLTDSREVTLIRKYNEIRYALNLEKNFNKSEIMEAYLNTIYLGESCYGVKTAAEKYFGKDIKDLNMAECASLLAITQSPYALDPLIFPEDNKARQEYCLGMLLETGKITQEEYEEAKSYKLVYTNSPDYVPSEDIKKKPAQEEKLYDFYTEYIIDSLIADFQNKLGYSKKKATDLVFYGGLRVYAAVDPDMQAIVTRVYSNRETFAKEENTPEHLRRSPQWSLWTMQAESALWRARRGPRAATEAQTARQIPRVHPVLRLSRFPSILLR